MLIGLTYRESRALFYESSNKEVPEIIEKIKNDEYR